ncbi:ATP-binding protein [Euzebya tangerina]|uniref:ATP-binding protein n=1 Tax=Euzebya tangerina TaxID=591198 RepID=UPI0023E8BD89|nr:ATP-binding protein [Euzebya tangerina]
MEDDGVTGGVAAGIGAWLGVDPLIVRLAFVVLSTAAGAGVLIYLFLRVWLPAEDPANPVPRNEPTVRHAVAVALVTQGLMLLFGSAGVYLTDALSVPVGLAAIGSGLVWVRASDDERAVWQSTLTKAIGDRELPDSRSFGTIRLAVGGCLVAAGIIAFFISSDLVTGLGALTDAILASVVTLVGVALVIAPWLQRQGSQLSAERRERIRSEERAEMAAHLHDSVLQTLALIQRADTREEITRLARGQERELRSWLFGRRPDDAPTTLGEAIMDMAGRVEDRYGVSVDVVRAGELTLDDHLIAMTEAAGEAMTNAAKHSGAARVDVFVEVEPETVAIFVRDEGVGFDVDTVASDRRGLVYSIEDRMARHGGKATIISDPGEGTEVELTLPLQEPSGGGRTPPEEQDNR